MVIYMALMWLKLNAVSYDAENLAAGDVRRWHGAVVRACMGWTWIVGWAMGQCVPACGLLLQCTRPILFYRACSMCNACWQLLAPYTYGM